MSASTASIRNGTLKQLLLLFATLITLLMCVATVSASSLADEEPVSISASVHVAKIEGAELQAKLVITADIADGQHIYAQTQPEPFLATRISVEGNNAIRLAGDFRPVRSPIVINHESLKVQLHEFEHQISWEAPIEISPGVDVESLIVNGEVFAQACDADSCFPPQTYEFAAKVKFVEAAESIVITALPPMDNGELAAATNANAAAASTFSLDSIDAEQQTESSVSVWAVLPLAFVAGFILNFMPCVLPVCLLYTSPSPRDRG